MSSIQIFHKADDGEETLVVVIDGDLIKAHSKTIREFIAAADAAGTPALVYKIVLKGPSFEALRFVVNQIVEAAKNKKVLDIKPRPRGISQLCRIHRAIKCLYVEPKQTSIPTQINGLLSNYLVTRTEMLAVHDAYGQEGHPYHKLFTTMVNTTAWKFMNGEIKEGQLKQLIEATQTQPSLDFALRAKMTELEEKKRVRAIIAAKRAAKAEKQRLAALEAWGEDASAGVAGDALDDDGTSSEMAGSADAFEESQAVRSS
jgi:hypothetical protein